jgi:hypothetical protein
MIEMIVALAVMGVATTIFVSLYRTSMELASSGSHQLVAAQLAEAQLQDIVRHPENYLWEIPETPDAARYRVKQDEDDPLVGLSFAGPGVAPAADTANLRNEKLYGLFTWRAYALFPRVEGGGLRPDPAYLDVVLEVRWVEGGRDQVLSLTSVVPFVQEKLPKPDPIPAAAPTAETAVEAE